MNISQEWQLRVVKLKLFIQKAWQMSHNLSNQLQNPFKTFLERLKSLGRSLLLTPIHSSSFLPAFPIFSSASSSASSSSSSPFLIQNWYCTQLVALDTIQSNIVYRIRIALRMRYLENCTIKYEAVSL